MSRPYFKNDLWDYAIHRGNQHAREAAIVEQAKKTKIKNKDTAQIVSQEVSEPPPKPLDVQEALKVQLKESPPKTEIDDEFRQLFSNFKSKKKAAENAEGAEGVSDRAVPKGLFFVPKNTIKVTMPAPALVKNQNNAKEIEKLEKKMRWDNWKMGQELRKNFKFESKTDEQGPKADQSAADSQAKENPDHDKKQAETPIREQAQQKQKTTGRKNKTTGRKKKEKFIKKQDNYVKTDLKRKYRDKFVGALSRNIRNMGKKNMYKERMKRLESELQMDEGEIYNSYVISLSKAMFMTISLDEEEEIQDEKLSYEIPTEYSRENLQKLIKDLFGFDGFREGQYETIKNILDCKSTLFVSETASGKSLTYLLASVILKGLTVVVSPLVSLMLDQLKHLPNDLPAACISSLLNRDQRNRVLTMVKQNKIQLLFVTPESFLTDFMYHVREFPPVNFVCIDEAHSMSELSHSFRASYLSLEEIILKYFRYRKNKPTVLCLTATANTETMDSISEKLLIEEIICSKTVINKNLFVTISREEQTGKYEAVLNYLRQDTIQKCNGILVYCRTKWIMTQVFNYLRNSGMGCRIYHSGLPQKEKVETMEKFREGKIRIVISTVALGMGLDFENLECVVHINMPKSVENYIQEIGRAGRRNKRAYCHLFLDKYDYFTERNYFLADELEKPSFQNIINELKINSEGVRKDNKSKNKKPPAKQRKSEETPQAEEQSLKRLSLNDEAEQDNIFYDEEEEEGSGAAKAKESNLNKEEQELLKLAEGEDVLDRKFMPLSYAKAQPLTELTNLKQEAILNILLKIEKNLGRKYFKVLPLSYDTIKISFYRNNQAQLEKESQFFKELVHDCKTIKGIVYVPMISKCNKLQMTPIQLLTDLYGLANTHWINIQMINEIFIWQHCSSVKKTFELLEDPSMSSKVMEDFNKVQRTSLTKFNIFYSICFSHSHKYLHSIISKGGLISHDEPLKEGGIMADFDRYFKLGTKQLYEVIANEGIASEDTAKKTDPLLQASYLPISEINQQVQIEIVQSVALFFRHILSNNTDKCFTQKIKPYRDGRTATRVFLGVNDTNSNWKVYGQHEYWSKFKDKDYKKLLKVVRNAIWQYIVQEGPKHLEAQNKISGLQSKRKQ